MVAEKAPNRRGRILYSILALLFAVGVVPLVWTSWELVSRSRESIESNQKEWQLDKARLISTQVAIYVDGLRTQVAAIARTLEVDPGPGSFAGRLARIKEQKALERYLKNSASLVYVSVVDPTGIGAQSGLDLLGDARLQEQLNEAFQRGQHGKAMISVPVVSESLQEPVVVMGEPISIAGRVEGVVLAVASLQPIRTITNQSGGGGLFEVYVVDNRGRLIAHSDADQPLSADVSGIDIVRIFLGYAEESAAAPPRPSGAAGRAERPASTSRSKVAPRGTCWAPTCASRTTRTGGSSSRSTSRRRTSPPSTCATSPCSSWRWWRPWPWCWARSWPGRSAARCRSWPTARVAWPAATTPPA